MIANRISKFSVGLLIFAVAFVSASFVTSNNSLKNVSSNTYLPLPPGKQTQLYNAAREARNLYHRPSSNNSPALAPGYLDYAQRHPELSTRALLGEGASDYYFRHPELSASAAASVDLSDYYFRHPEMSASSAQESIDLTDYYFRHINDQ